MRRQIWRACDSTSAGNSLSASAIRRKANASRLAIARTAYEACEGAHAIAILTEWDEFKALDFARILASMPKPAFIFDGRNILDLPKLRALGFQAFGIGK